MGIRAICQQLRSSHQPTVLAAVWDAQRLLPPSAVEPLCRLLPKLEGAQGEGVACALGKIGDRGAVSALRKAVRRADEKVAAAAALALMRIRAPEAAGDLIRCFRGAPDRFTRGVIPVRASCAVALAVAGQRKYRREIAAGAGNWRRHRSVWEDYFAIAVDLLDCDCLDVLALRLRTAGSRTGDRGLLLRQLPLYGGEGAVRVWREFVRHHRWLAPRRTKAPRWAGGDVIEDAAAVAAALGTPETFDWLCDTVAWDAVPTLSRIKVVRCLAGFGEPALAVLGTRLRAGTDDEDLALALADAAEGLAGGAALIDELAVSGRGCVRSVCRETVIEREGLASGLV